MGKNPPMKKGMLPPPAPPPPPPLGSNNVYKTTLPQGVIDDVDNMMDALFGEDGEE